MLHAVEPVTADGAGPADALELLEQRVAGAVAIHFDDFFGGLHAVSLPPMLDAYREYRAGLETFMSDYPRTLMHLERALDREPTFLLPLVIMYFAYGNLDEFEKTEAVLIRMEAQSDRLTPAERFLIEFLRANWERPAGAGVSRSGGPGAAGSREPRRQLQPRAARRHAQSPAGCYRCVC